jgi:hypothetical protein
MLHQYWGRTMSAVLTRYNPWAGHGDPPAWRVERLQLAADYKRKCEFCKVSMARNDLAVITMEKMGAPRVGNYGPIQPYRTKVYHRGCWYQLKGTVDWYYPGILAEMPDDVREEVEQAVDKGMVELADERLSSVGVTPAQTETSVAVAPAPAPTAPVAFKRPTPELMHTPWWKKLVGSNPMAKKQQRSVTRTRVIHTREGTDVNINMPGFQGQAPPAPVERIERPIHVSSPPPPQSSGGGLWGWLIIAAIAGAGFAGYWFFIKTKYKAGQLLQHLVGGIPTDYQISALKYVGIVHTYVMIDQSSGLEEEFPVSEVDKDTANWIPI